MTGNNFVFVNHCGVEGTGDVVGRSIWKLTQEGMRAATAFDWHLRAEKPPLKHFSFAPKPLFFRNHRWAMERGHKGLLREIEHRKTVSQ